MKFYLICLWLNILLPLYAVSQQNNLLDSCLNHSKMGEYQNAVDCLNNFLLNHKGADTNILISAYEALGVNLVMLGHKPIAKNAFVLLLKLSPEYDLDPTIYLPDVIATFQIAKFEKRTSFRVLIVDTLPAYPGILNFAPFGVPQVFNKSWIKAGICGILQVAAIGISVYAYQKEQSLKQDGAFFNGKDYYNEEDEDHAVFYDILHKTCFFAFGLTYVYGIIDGFRNKPLSSKSN
ncbi:MAG: hypothetical protein ABIA63_10160 [bacterium]